jgi:hypothetical protein
MSNETELAWAAGFFDGEGCTTIIKRKKEAHHNERWYICVSVGQSEPTTLQRFCDAVGVGSVQGPWERTPSTKKDGSPSPRKPNWEFRVVTSKAQEAMDKLWPYLSNIKREQYRRKVQEVNEFYGR